ncbi:unnamed protein product [Sphagnum troendelagicum]
MLDGSDLVKPGRMLIHAPRMLFHMEQGALFSLGAANIQLMSSVHGPFPCTGSLVWSAWCLISSFHGSPPGASPLTKSFASRASDCLGVDDAETAFRDWQGESIPLHFGPGGCGFAAPDEVPDHSPYLAAHSGVWIPACRQDVLSFIHVGLITFEIQGSVVCKRLVSDAASFGQGQTFYPMPGIFQHVTQHVGGYDEEIGS